MNAEEKQQILIELGGIPEDTYNELIKELLPTLQQQISEMRRLLEKGDLKELITEGASVASSF